MSDHTCNVSTEQLLGWWLAEGDSAEQSRIDQHLFACGACTHRLTALIQLAEAIRHETLRGTFGFVVPVAFIDRMKSAGLVVREYALHPGGSVNCTIAPADDFVAAKLHAKLDDVHRLDLLVDDDMMGKVRLADVPFDAATGTLAVVPSAAFLRTVQVAQQRMRLVAVEGEGERVVGDYTFNHSPYTQQA
jgi:hypothetical protein